MEMGGEAVHWEKEAAVGMLGSMAQLGRVSSGTRMHRHPLKPQRFGDGVDLRRRSQCTEGVAFARRWLYVLYLYFWSIHVLVHLL